MRDLILRPLKPIDLEECDTIGSIVAALSLCSFGGRMLGNVVEEIVKTISSGIKPFVVYDGKRDTPLHALLERMCKVGWFKEINTTKQYVNSQLANCDSVAVVVGHYRERYEDRLYRKTKNLIYINKDNQSNPAGLQEGFYPNRVFSDPEFVMPIIYYSLLERLRGIKQPVDVLINDLENYDGVAKEIFSAAKVFSQMVNDPDCKVFLTLTGAMTVAKMGLILDYLVASGMVQYVSSTGALLSHGAIENLGLMHYFHDPKFSDVALRDGGFNRVTDTLEPEGNFDTLEKVLSAVFRQCANKGKMMGSIALHRAIGRHIDLNYPGERGIFPAAFRTGVPIQVPAFIDSESANDLYIFNLARMLRGHKPLIIVPELDTRILVRHALSAKKMGIFSIGGGVPRNNVQNVACLIDLMKKRLGRRYPSRMFSYGCRIDPASIYLGHLSGCSYQEGKSWGKFRPDAMTAEVHADATIVLAFIVKYAMMKRVSLAA